MNRRHEWIIWPEFFRGFFLGAVGALVVFVVVRVFLMNERSIDEIIRWECMTRPSVDDMVNWLNTQGRTVSISGCGPGTYRQVRVTRPNEPDQHVLFSKAKHGRTIREALEQAVRAVDSGANDARRDETARSAPRVSAWPWLDSTGNSDIYLRPWAYDEADPRFEGSRT